MLFDNELDEIEGLELKSKLTLLNLSKNRIK